MTQKKLQLGGDRASQGNVRAVQTTNQSQVGVGILGSSRVLGGTEKL